MNYIPFIIGGLFLILIINAIIVSVKGFIKHYKCKKNGGHEYAKATRHGGYGVIAPMRYKYCVKCGKEIYD